MLKNQGGSHFLSCNWAKPDRLLAAAFSILLLFSFSGCANTFMEWIVGGKKNTPVPETLSIDVPDNLVKLFSPLDNFAHFDVTVGGFINAADAYLVGLVIDPVPGLTITGNDAIGYAVNGVKTFRVMVTAETAAVFTAIEGGTTYTITIAGLANAPAAGYSPFYLGANTSKVIKYADGNTAGNPIPVTQENIVRTGTGFNDYAMDYSYIRGYERHYILFEDVTLQSGGPYWTAIGSMSDRFTGSFDGNGKTISNLTINSPSNFQGMFGYVDSTGSGPGVIKNLALKDCHIAAPSGSNVGGIAGSNNGTIQNCAVLGASVINGGSLVGGVVGANQKIIEHCYALGTAVNCTGNVAGGVAGENNGTVRYCYFAGVSVTGLGSVGGVAGKNDGTVKNCYARGSITASSSGNAGGIVGESQGTVQYCFFAGTSVSGNNNVGGVVGYGNPTVKNCVALNKNIEYTSFNFGRVGGVLNGISANFDKLYGRNDMTYSGFVHSWTDNNDFEKDGEDIDQSYWNSADWWKDTAGFADPWWNGKLPPKVP